MDTALWFAGYVILIGVVSVVLFKRAEKGADAVDKALDSFEQELNEQDEVKSLHIAVFRTHGLRGQLLFLTARQQQLVFENEIEFTWNDEGEVHIRSLSNSPQVNGCYRTSASHELGDLLCFFSSNLEEVQRALESFEEDALFAQEEAPADPADEVATVASASVWMFVFAERSTVDHVILTPRMWRQRQWPRCGQVNLERLSELPTAKQVYAKLGIVFDEHADRSEGAYRQHPTRGQLQEFANGLGKIIMLYGLTGNEYGGYSLIQKYWVKPVVNLLKPR